MAAKFGECSSIDEKSEGKLEERNEVSCNSDSSSTFSSTSVFDEEELDQVLDSLKEEHNLFVSFLTLLISKLITIDKFKSEKKPEADHLQTEIAQLVIDVADIVVDDDILNEGSVKEFKQKIAERISNNPSKD
ncbi:unnamed protein product [Dimorphilus gyrociliatus]|uniref:Uncharacterized protein n=1 Tax=Dimorphilus gyrociliatus TaxID=2664684 RepID=A0A7I8WCU2_9ANNE|nr:unnamed protein product [Dimorphilus gyrociliatus]